MSRRPASTGLDGVLVVDKPAGPTSHDVVRTVRRLLGQPRSGHAGTLDPGATGVLCIGLGSATRLLRFAGGGWKHYVGEVVLGSSTTTLDDQGEVLERACMSGVGAAELERAAAGLRGAIMQRPPMVSAVRVGGRRLHELSRAGEEVERAERPVHVASLRLSPTQDDQVWQIDVECSSGTYVRVLADELGRRAGGRAHLRGLRRLAAGGLRIDEAVDLGQLGALGPGAILPPSAAVRVLWRAHVTGAQELGVRHGSTLALARSQLEPPEAEPAPTCPGAASRSGLAGTHVALVAPSGELLGVYHLADDGVGRAEVVLASGR